MAEKPQSEKNPALSILRMEHVFFEELSFRREAPSSEGWNRPRLEITPEMEATGENQYRVSLEVLAIQEDVFTAKVKVCGDFSIEGGVDADLKEIVIKRNTMSILFPFVACNPQRIAALRRLVQNDGYCAIIAVLIIAQVLSPFPGFTHEAGRICVRPALYAVLQRRAHTQWIPVFPSKSGLTQARN